MSTDPSLFSTLMNIFAGVYSDATPIAYAVCIIWIGQRLLRRTYSFFPKHSLPATILYFLVFPVIILSSVAYSSGHKVRKAPLTSFPTVEVEGQDFNGTSKATLYLIRNLSDGVLTINQTRTLIFFPRSTIKSISVGQIQNDWTGVFCEMKLTCSVAKFFGVQQD